MNKNRLKAIQDHQKFLTKMGVNKTQLAKTRKKRENDKPILDRLFKKQDTQGVSDIDSIKIVDRIEVNRRILSGKY